jgi:hypothetical protein
MEIVNDTSQDTRVRVTGGGTGAAPHNPSYLEDDSSKWPLLPAGGLLSHESLSPPWTVCFAVNGKQVRKEVRHTARKITLAKAGSAFRVDVE